MKPTWKYDGKLYETKLEAEIPEDPRKMESEAILEIIVLYPDRDLNLQERR